MSTHTYGCTSATAAIAATASVATATVIISNIEAIDVAKNMQKVRDATLPLTIGFVTFGTAAALAQALKTPSTQSLWIGAAGLLASTIPYTYFVEKDDLAALLKAGEEKKAPEAGTIKRLALHGYVATGLMLASTGLMVFALAKKAKR